MLLFCTATLSCPNPSRRTAKVDLDTLFKAANWEPKGAENDDNPLEALTRQEWLEVIVRLAKAKFGQAAKQLAPAVDALVYYIRPST